MKRGFLLAVLKHNRCTDELTIGWPTCTSQPERKLADTSGRFLNDISTLPTSKSHDETCLGRGEPTIM